MMKGFLTGEEYERLKDEERANALQDEQDEISLEEVMSVEEEDEDDGLDYPADEDNEDPFAEVDPQDER